MRRGPSADLYFSLSRDRHGDGPGVLNNAAGSGLHGNRKRRRSAATSVSGLWSAAAPAGHGKNNTKHNQSAQFELYPALRADGKDQDAHREAHPSKEVGQ